MIRISVLDQIKAKEYKYPDEIYKVPVQSCLFNHFIMASLIKMSKLCFSIHHHINYNTTENVKAVETSDTKEIPAECDRAAMCCMKTTGADLADQLTVRH